MSNLNSLSNNNLNNKKNVLSKFKSGRNYSNLIGIVIAIVSLVIIIMLLYKLNVTYQANKVANTVTITIEKNMFDCKNNHKIIDAGILKKSAIGNEYNLSFWIYVSDLQHNYLDNKNVLTKGDITDHITDTNKKPIHINPRIYIPAKSQSLHFEFELENFLDPGEGCYHIDKTPTYSLAPEFSNSPALSNLECQSIHHEKDYYALSKPIETENSKLVRCIGLSEDDVVFSSPQHQTNNKDCINANSPSQSKDYTHGSDNYTYIHKTSGTGDETCIIENLPLQKWNCISMNVHNNMCDVFLNNKLEVSTAYSGSIKPNDLPLIMGAIDTRGDAGFDGYLSNVQYSNYAITVGDVNRYFKQGPKIVKGFKETIKSFF